MYEVFKNARFVVKICTETVAQCMGPFPRTWEEVNEAHGDHTSTLEIEDVVKLLEKAILMIGHVDVAYLYERSINFLAKILKCTKEGKAWCATWRQNFRTTLYSFGLFLWYQNLKDRKRARKMPRDIARHVTKKPRLIVVQPFRQGLSGEQTRTRCVK